VGAFRLPQAPPSVSSRSHATRLFFIRRQDGIGDGVADFVGVAFTDGFGRENITTRHSQCGLRVGCGCGAIGGHNVSTNHDALICSGDLAGVNRKFGINCFPPKMIHRELLTQMISDNNVRH
jgi:hypothetical protein